MQFVPKQRNLSTDQRQLLDLFGGLDVQGRETLLAFAQFLATRDDGSGSSQEEVAQEPKRIDRPEQESVVKAIKRLSATYYMLEREQLLDQTSSLMMSHVMQGRDAVSVIDELEVIFSEHYQRYLESE
ncbi:MAG: Crp/Fnr family transcriptional regulator [Candidatus Thiodiazotropha sp. (ex Semelilucina semeliformis)]|nr:Crp/Fnr family transcriptional regulator [Candidatus Thiodiazotropha sp. (ex Semelilucina semeliformis)]